MVYCRKSKTGLVFFFFFTAQAVYKIFLHFCVSLMNYFIFSALILQQLSHWSICFSVRYIFITFLGLGHGGLSTLFVWLSCQFLVNLPVWEQKLKQYLSITHQWENQIYRDLFKCDIQFILWIIIANGCFTMCVKGVP